MRYITISNAFIEWLKGELQTKPVKEAALSYMRHIFYYEPGWGFSLSITGYAYPADDVEFGSKWRDGAEIHFMLIRGMKKINVVDDTFKGDPFTYALCLKQIAREIAGDSHAFELSLLGL